MRWFLLLIWLGSLSTPAAGQRIPTEKKTALLILSGPLNGIRDVKASKDGRFFVLTDDRVHAYDVKGTPIRRFEGKANATMPPLSNPVALHIADSTFTIRDLGTRRLSTFRFDGTYTGTQFMQNASEPEVRWKMRGGVTLIERTPRVLPAPDSVSAGVAPERTIAIRAGSITRNLFSIPVDTAYFRASRDSVVGLPNQPRSMRNGAALQWRPVATRFGAGGAWATSGDSLLAHAVGHTGIIRWYAIDERGATIIDSARLGRPVRRVTSADIADEAARLQRLVSLRTPIADRRSGNATPPQLKGTPPVWSVATKAFFARDGALWVGVNRMYFDATDSTAVRIGDDNTWTVFPRQGDAFILTLRPLFRLTDVVGDRLYGFVEGSGIVPSIEVYSFR